MSHQQVTFLTLINLFATIYYGSFYTSWTSFILVWQFFHCSLFCIKSNLLNRFSMSIMKTLNHLYSNSFMEFIKDESTVLFSSPLFSVLSYLIQKKTIPSMLMILNFSYHSHLRISLKTSLTLKTLLLTHLTGCLPTCSLFFLLKLRFSSLVYRNNSLYSIISYSQTIAITLFLKYLHWLKIN